ncbi:MAG: hypothetical protein JKY65_20110 [Planctomycetes bacterium]|nr:hypothetical protein [Planctomycetota bacterium]
MYDNDDPPLNPYAPPEAEVEDLQAAPTSELGRAEAIRREHIRHEGSIKTLGCLHFFGGGFTVLGGMFVVVGISSGRTRGAEGIGAVLGVVAVGLALLTSGYGLRTLKPWTRVLSSILCGLGLFSFPFGTLFNAYFLWLILSAKGTTVFSEDYKYIVTATPHVKYVPWVAIVFLGLLVFVILAGVIAAMAL